MLEMKGLCVTGNLRGSVPQPSSPSHAMIFSIQEFLIFWAVFATYAYVVTFSLTSTFERCISYFVSMYIYT